MGISKEGTKAGAKCVRGRVVDKFKRRIGQFMWLWEIFVQESDVIGFVFLKVYLACIIENIIWGGVGTRVQ